MKNPEVLIVGAGPVGLTGAAELSRLGVPVRIIDKNEARSTQSKALGVQAGTLECLAASFGPGFSQKMIETGHPADSIYIHLNKKNPVKVDFGLIPSIYNFVLILPQGETERLLEEKLHRFSVFVERKTEMLSLRQNGDKVHCLLRGPDGTESEVISDFVIGADGAHSQTRHQLEIPFMGGSYSKNFVLGDVQLEWPWEYGSIRTFISGKGFLGGFPLDGGQGYRLVVAESKEYEDKGHDVSLKEFSDLVSSMTPKPIKIKSASWLARFNAHHRMTKNFQKGRVFLAGDAAHIHSPAGGQGMNMGMQDALNISFKLAQVLREKAPLSLLAEYEQERMPVAKKVVRSTDLVTRLALMPENHLSQFLREKILPWILQSEMVQRNVVAALSQVSVARKEISRRENATQ